MWGSKCHNNCVIFLTIGLLCLLVSLVNANALNVTEFRENESNTRIGRPPVYRHHPLIPTPRDFFLGNGIGNQVITDIQNILNTLTGGNAAGGTGTVVFIIIAAATAIFWIIIFLIIYYSIYAKKEKEEEGYGSGGYGGYSGMTSQFGHGRSLIPDGLMNRVTDMAWKAVEKLAIEYGKI